MDRNGNESPALWASEAQRRDFAQKLLELLARQVREYTAGESSSLPAETARALLDSLCYCMGLTEDNWPQYLHLDLWAAYQTGAARLRGKLEPARALWQQLCLHLPPAESRSMLDTLKGIGGFWQRYDPRFFARELPCDIDYQLAVPVPEPLCGIDYLARYLESLWIENRFLRRFGAWELVPVLEKYSPDSRELLVNLFEPVFANALGLAVLGRSPAPLLLRRQELRALYAVFDRLPPRELEACLMQAARLLWAPDDAAQRYFRHCCTQLAPRIAVLRDVGGLSGVFQTEA